MQQAEYLGDAGKIEESERVNEEVQNLRRAKEDLITLAENPTMVAKQMKVCEVCGAMQATNDTEKRNQTHLEGKVHTGFLKLRAELAKLERRKEVLKLHLTTQRAIKKEEVKTKIADRVQKNETRKRSNSREDRRDNGDRDEKRKDKDKERRRSKDRRSREKHRERSREKTRKKGGEPSRDRDESREDRKKKQKKDKRARRSRSRS